MPIFSCRTSKGLENTTQVDKYSNAKRWLIALSFFATLIAAPAQAAETPVLLYSENFESGNLSSLNIVGNQTATVIRLRDCNQVGFFKLKRDTDAQSFSFGWPNKNMKVLEACHRAYRLHFRLFFPDMKRDSTEDTLFTIVERHKIETGLQGPITLSVLNGQFIFKVDGKTVWCSNSYCERRWYDFVIDCHLDAPPKGNDTSHSYVKLTVDGCPVLNDRGPNIPKTKPYTVMFGVGKVNGLPTDCKLNRAPINRQVYFDDIQVNASL